MITKPEAVQRATHYSKLRPTVDISLMAEQCMQMPRRHVDYRSDTFFVLAVPSLLDSSVRSVQTFPGTLII